MEIFNRLNKNQIKYCHWKSNQHLHDSINGKTDLDILVAHEDIENMVKTLTDCGFIKVTSPAWSTYVGVSDWLGLDEKTGKILHIHLHSRLITGTRFVKEIHLPFEEIVLNTRIFDDETGLYIIDPNLELIILTIRIGAKTNDLSILKSLFYHKSLLPDNIEDEIRYLLQKIDEEKVLDFCNRLFDNPEKVYSLIKGLGEKITINNILSIKSFVFFNLSKYRKINFLLVEIKLTINMLRVSLIKTLKRIGFHIKLKKDITDGVVVSLIGSDGSGKTSAIHDLYTSLSWKLNVEKFYLGNHPVFNKLKKNKKLNQVNTMISGRKSFIKLVYVDIRKSINAVRRYRLIKKIIKLRKRGFIIITDRLPQNVQRGFGDGPSILLEDSKNILHKLFFNYEKYLYDKMSLFSPDLVVKLHVDKQTALMRKPDHSAENLDRKIELVKNIEFANSKVLDIDTNNSSRKQVSLQIKKFIWEFFQKQNN